MILFTCAAGHDRSQSYQRCSERQAVSQTRSFSMGFHLDRMESLDVNKTFSK